jgi:predicted MFS family arabinose efflux permease
MTEKEKLVKPRIFSSVLESTKIDRNIKFLGFGAAVRALGIAILYPYITIFLSNILGIDYLSIGLLLLLVGILPLLVSPFGGLVVDRMGRRNVFLITLSIEAVCVAIVAASMMLVYVPGIIAGAAVANVAGGALAAPALLAYTADLTTIAERSAAYSWQRIGFNAGYTVGVAAGGSLIYALGYSNAGFIAALFMGTAVVILALVLSPSPYDLAHAKNHAGVGSHPLQGAHSSIRESFKILGNDRYFLLLCVGFFFTNLATSQWSNTLPLYLGSVLGLSSVVVGVALALNGLIVVLGQIQVTRWATGRMHTSAANTALMLYSVSSIMLGATGLGGSGGLMIAVVMLAIIILTFGENFKAIPMTTMPSNLAPPTEIGSYNGAAALFAGAGGAFAPVLDGYALSVTSNTLLSWVLMTIPAVPAIFLFAWLGKRLSRNANVV